MKYTALFILFLILAVSPAKAQDSLLRQRFISVQHDNDLFNLAGQVTDEYYTAGTYVNYSFLTRSDKNILNKILLSGGHTPYSFLSVGLTQWLYTPGNLESMAPRQGDYPYSGSLFVGLSRETAISPKKIFRSELWLGMMGPGALARQTQTVVHKVIDAVQPEGWENQLPDYPIINYNLYFESNLADLGIMKINGFIHTQTGTLLNTAEAGLNLLGSNNKDDFFPQRMYTLMNKKRGNAFKIYIQLMPSIKFVASNSILQGSLFGEKGYYYVKQGELQRILFLASGVLGIHLRHFSILYRQTFETKEFKTVHSHVYGVLALVLKI